MTRTPAQAKAVRPARRRPRVVTWFPACQDAASCFSAFCRKTVRMTPRTTKVIFDRKRKSTP